MNSTDRKNQWVFLKIEGFADKRSFPRPTTSASSIFWERLGTLARHVRYNINYRNDALNVPQSHIFNEVLTFPSEFEWYVSHIIVH